MIDRRTFLLAPLALTAAQRKPNLVLLVARGWRGQATPWAGDPDLVAPNLERFGRESVVFTRAYSCYPRTTPARAALLTGRYPHSIGVIKDGVPLPAGEPTLETVLRSAGYDVKNQVRYMRYYIDNKADGALLITLILEPPRFSGPSDPALLHPRPNVPADLESRARKDLAYYYGNLLWVDGEVGNILDAMDHAGFAENTIVVFTADHGRQIGSHGSEDDDLPFEESVRIPLALRYPRTLQPSASDLLVSQVDIMPTLLALCGETVPEAVQGRDLPALLSGQKGERPESVYCEGKIGQKDEWRMMVLGFDKIVVNSQTEVTHLYNLADDPYELTNLAHEPAEQLKRDQLIAVLRASARRLGDFKRRQ